jgi:hypothetical protein
MRSLLEELPAHGAQREPAGGHRGFAKNLAPPSLVLTRPLQVLRKVETSPAARSPVRHTLGLANSITSGLRCQMPAPFVSILPKAALARRRRRARTIHYTLLQGRVLIALRISRALIREVCTSPKSKSAGPWATICARLAWIDCRLARSDGANSGRSAG